MALDRADTWTQNSPLQAVVDLLGRLVRRVQTPTTELSRVEKFARCAAVFPVFSLLVLILRVRVLFGQKPLEVVTRTTDGLVFRCNPPDLIQMYLWIFGVWEPELTTFIVERLRAGDAFLDVGANIGYFSVLAARRVGENGFVVAMEPSPAVFPRLEETVRLNGADAGIRRVNAAAGRDASDVPVYSGPAHNMGLTTTVAQRGFGLEGVVRALPLDAVLTPEERPVLRLIKIDVEGAEPDVLAGMQSLVRDSGEDVEILIELSPDWWADQSLTVPGVLQSFLDAGFNVYEIRNSYWPWRYLWPRSVPRPKRRRSRLPARAHRLDLILSRRDAEFL